MRVVIVGRPAPAPATPSGRSHLSISLSSSAWAEHSAARDGWSDMSIWKQILVNFQSRGGRNLDLPVLPAAL